MSELPSAVLTGRTAVLIRRAISGAVLVIAGFSFAFGFGNAWSLGLELGVSRWVAPCVGPAVDLTVTVLVVALQYARVQGVTDRLLGARILLGVAGLATFALNAGQPLSEHLYRRALFDSVTPTLLIMWAEVAPALLAQLYVSPAVPESADDAGTVPDDSGPLGPLLKRARELDAAHRAAHGRKINRDAMRAGLGVSNALAGELLRHIRAEQQDGGPA